MIRWPSLGMWGEFEPCEEGIIQAINQNFFLLDALAQMSIIDFVTELPDDPNLGDKYILESGSYAYDGGPNSIMIFNGTEWVEITAQLGFMAYVETEDDYFWFNGADWILFPKTLGDVSGPASSIANSIARFDGITGKWITDSGVMLDDDNVIANVSALYTEVLLTDEINVGVNVDSSSAGVAQDLSALSKLVTKFTGSLDSINSIAAPSAGSYGQLHILVNETGGVLSLIDGTSIRTGMSADLDMADGSAVWIMYDPVDSIWIVIGGSGGGGFSNVVSNSTALSSSDEIAINTALTFQTFRVKGDSGPVDLSMTPFGTTPPDKDGSIIVLIGIDDDNAVTVKQNDAANGCLMDGDVILYKGYAQQFMWISTDSRYVRS